MALGLLGGIALLYVGLCAAFFFLQRAVIYHPRQAGRADGDVLAFDSGGERILVSVRPLAGPKAVIYFGGNAEDVSWSLPEYAAAYEDRAVYLMRYRGYGGSTGSPTEAGLIEDGLALFDLVAAKHQQVTVIGRSLGSAIAVRVASQRRVEALVLVTPFVSLEDMASRMLPFLPARWLLRDKYDSGKYAPEVEAPTLLVVAGRDEIVPRASTELLAERFRPGLARVAVVVDADHNDLSERQEYWALLRGERQAGH